MFFIKKNIFHNDDSEEGSTTKQVSGHAVVYCSMKIAIIIVVFLMKLNRNMYMTFQNFLLKHCGF